MKRAIAIEQDLKQIATVKDLTEVFEGIASVKIARIRNKVVVGKAFFNELWHTYSSIRIDTGAHLSRSKHTNGKRVYVAVTSSGKLSGDIATRVIDEMVGSLEPSDDLIILGSSGSDRLAYHGKKALKIFPLPDSDDQFDVSGIIEVLSVYKQITVFYQSYESLRIQQVARIELVAALQELSSDIKTEKNADIVSTKDYIFEPDVSQIAEYLESLMLGVALSQVLMESKLAQHAARFNAMNLAKQRARELTKTYDVDYHRAKRAEADERLKESMKLSEGLLT